MFIDTCLLFLNVLHKKSHFYEIFPHICVIRYFGYGQTSMQCIWFIAYILCVCSPRIIVLRSLSKACILYLSQSYSTKTGFYEIKITNNKKIISNTISYIKWPLIAGQKEDGPIEKNVCTFDPVTIEAKRWWLKRFSYRYKHIILYCCIVLQHACSCRANYIHYGTMSHRHSLSKTDVLPRNLEIYV